MNFASPWTGRNGRIQTTHHMTPRSTERRPKTQQQQNQKAEQRRAQASSSWRWKRHTRGYSFSIGEYLQTKSVVFRQTCPSVLEDCTQMTKLRRPDLRDALLAPTMMQGTEDVGGAAGEAHVPARFNSARRPKPPNPDRFFI